MNRKIMLFFLVLCILILGYSYSFRKVQPILKYFPKDSEVYFEITKTNLVSKNNEEPCILWQNQSKTSKPVYLRQDVGLLYGNGNLIGIKNIWKEQAQELNFKEKICTDKNTIFHSVTFVHGEVHRKDQITSLYEILDDQLILLQTDTNDFIAFQKKDNFVNPFLEQVTNNFDQKLSRQFNRLLSYFQINEQAYYSVPLIHLTEAYREGLLPLPERDKEQILGQLLEGLYKNYIIPSLEGKVKGKTNIPIILFSKDQTHLITIFILNNEYEKLIQKYPV